MHEYVLVPIGFDGEEVEVGDDPNPIRIQIADLTDEITLIGTPKDLPRESLQMLAEEFERRENTGRLFILLDGGIPDTWQAVRLVPREDYDAVLRERKPGT